MALALVIIAVHIRQKWPFVKPDPRSEAWMRAHLWPPVDPRVLS